MPCVIEWNHYRPYRPERCHTPKAARVPFRFDDDVGIPDPA